MLKTAEITHSLVLMVCRQLSFQSVISAAPRTTRTSSLSSTKPKGQRPMDADQIAKLDERVSVETTVLLFFSSWLFLFFHYSEDCSGSIPIFFLFGRLTLYPTKQGPYQIDNLSLHPNPTFFTTLLIIWQTH